MRIFRWLILAACLAAPATAQPNGIAGVMQAASDSPLIYDTFDRPDGTVINGQALASGNTTWVDGNANAENIGGKLTNVLNTGSGNSYSGFANTTTVGGTPQPIRYMWGVFQHNIVGVAYCPTTLIADQDGTMTKFLHLELCSDHWVFSVADAPSYPFETILASDAYQMLAPGVPHRAAFDIDAVACKIKIYLPDGTTRTVTHPAICDVNPKFTHYQLGGFSPVGYGSWLAVGVGHLKADLFAAAGGAASQADLNVIQNQMNKIGGQKSPVILGSPTLFATFQTSGPQTANRLRISTVTTDNSAVLPSGAMEVDDWEMTILSTGCCNYVGSVKSLNSTSVPGLGICITNSLTYSISGTPGYPYTVNLYSQPNTYGGCPNNGYATSARINYTVQADGDPYGILTKQ